jgi:hypothetical protein
MQIEMVTELFDASKHKSALKPTHKNPKLPTEVQAKINLIDWQKKINEISDPFSHYMETVQTKDI